MFGGFRVDRQADFAGTTAVASISTLARSSTSATTCTSVIAGKVPADDAPVGLPDLARAREVFPLVGDVPGEANEVLGPRVGLREDVDDVAQRLLDLRHEIVVDDLLTRVPTDLAGHEHLAALRRHAVGEASRRGPVLRVQKLHG